MSSELKSMFGQTTTGEPLVSEITVKQYKEEEEKKMKEYMIKKQSKLNK